MNPARGAVALVAAIALVIGGGVLAVALGRANPAPDEVLASAQRFVGRSPSVLFDATIRTEVPTVTAGQTLVRDRTVTGTVEFAATADVEVHQGRSVGELRFNRTVPTTPWLARGASSPDSLGAEPWHRFATLTDIERQIGANGPALDAAVLTDEASVGDVIPSAVASARQPRRATSSDARDIAAVMTPRLTEPSVVLSGADGELVVGHSGAPKQLRLTLRAGSVVVTATYVFVGWNVPVDVAVPAPSDIAG